ncbi:MAG: response regulator [Candidatus Hydrogenedentes bacterium]|nr:response regulator [Candidatus Hydrogenedentota bacterium]
MRTRAATRGIERKILTSILWVGILPTTLALLVAYLSAREGQKKATEDALATAAQKTADGLQMAANARLRTVSRLALDISGDPAVVSVFVAATDPATENRDELPTWAALKERLQKEANGAVDGPSIFCVYDARGRLLFGTRPWQDADPRPFDWVGKIQSATFIDADYEQASNEFTAQAMAPIFTPGTGQCVGYVSEIVNIQPLINYVLGGGTQRSPGVQPVDNYQIIYSRDEQFYVLHLAPDASATAPILVTQPLDARLAREIGRTSGVGGTILDLSHYAVGNTSQDVLLAFHRVFGYNQGFVAVYRPESQVFSVINLWALLCFGVWALIVGFLSLNAYRHVHNNIVLPVSLLNEGAQIIERGDLELKLKIRTGDEIEELASSFNKMALALKRNISQLEESEEKYRSLVTSMRDGIFQSDSEGIVGFLNPAGVEILGFTSATDATGQDLRTLFQEDADFARIASELQQKGFIERSRIWMKRHDGRAICVELSGNRVHDDEGRVVGLEGIFRDVTKNVRLEHEVRERAERLSAVNQIANVINSSLEAGRLYESLVVEVHKLVDFDFAALALLSDRGESFSTRQLWPESEKGPGRLTSVTDEHSCSAWVARERQCLVVNDLGAPASLFAAEFPAAMGSCLCVPLYATGRIIGTLNLGTQRADGFTKRDVEILEQMAPHVAVAIRNAQLLDNLQLSLEEVTRARERLHAANDELKTLDEMKTNLLSNVSHELRTPLVAVMGYTDMIFNGKVGPINEVQKEYLGISLRNVEKLVTLIENLLDFSRLHRGAETIVFDTFDVLDCARASLQLVQPVADSRNIMLNVVASGDQILVEGDKGKMGQVFNNLLSNAVKFNKNGGSVTVEIRQSDETVNVAVSDTGIGIPPEALDKVFTRFYQYDSSSTRKYGGTGIGLSIAQDIVRLHGSRITVTSEADKGSTFRFSLPLTSARRDAVAKPAPELPVPSETQVLVELVTKDRALSAQFQNLLLPEGMNLIHAVGPVHAISLAQKYSPDCILVDIEAGDNGPTVLDDLLSDPATGHVPIIMLTNDDELYTRYSSLVATRIKRGFRKSSLLSGIHYALNASIIGAEPLGTRILCVDDDAEILKFMCRCLQTEGYTADPCISGEEALQRVSTREYGLILLDIAMPGMDGWEACRRMKSDPALMGIKIYVVTAKPVDTTRPRFQESGADGFLLKPFKSEDLVELVQNLQGLRPAKSV